MAIFYRRHLRAAAGTYILWKTVKRIQILLDKPIHLPEPIYILDPNPTIMIFKKFFIF